MSKKHISYQGWSITRKIGTQHLKNILGCWNVLVQIARLARETNCDVHILQILGRYLTKHNTRPRTTGRHTVRKHQRRRHRHRVGRDVCNSWRRQQRAGGGPRYWAFRYVYQFSNNFTSELRWLAWRPTCLRRRRRRRVRSFTGNNQMEIFLEWNGAARRRQVWDDEWMSLNLVWMDSRTWSPGVER